MLLAAAPLLLWLAQAPALPPYGAGDWHVEVLPGRELTAVFREEVRFPHLVPRRWIVVASCPAETPAQKTRRCALALRTTDGAAAGEPLREKQAPGRAYLRAAIPASASAVPRGYLAEATYQVHLLPRRLVPGKPSAAPAEPSPEERRRYLASTKLIPWDRGPLAAWIRDRALARRPGESAVAFAWRVAQALRADYRYGGQDWNAANVAQKHTGTCEGLSSVIVAALRANGIPARLHLGFWVDQPGTTAAHYHVRLEFFAPEAGGWLPVDGSGLVTWKDWPQAFGQDPGQFLAVQIETGLRVDTGAFGTQEVVQLQRPASWPVGAGNLEDAQRTPTVTVQPVPH